MADPVIAVAGVSKKYQIYEQPIDRLKCRSYEAYMLQFLKWFFGFARTEMQQVALHEGGPQNVAAYLLRQLEATPEQRDRLNAVLTAYGNGALLRRIV